MTFKVKVVALDGEDTIISQVGATNEGAIHGLVICNNNVDSRSVTIKLQDASEGVTSVIATVSVPANSQFTWPKPINLEPNDALIGVGPDLVALHSTYVDAATQIAVGFTGRGTWSSSATYQINDVVSYEGDSYLANAINTDSEPPSANWTLLAAKGEDSPLLTLIRKPTAISPVTGGVNAAPNGPLVASPYASIYYIDSRDYRRFELTTPADTDFEAPVFTSEVNADSVFVSPLLTPAANYIWRCKDYSVSGEESPWMDTQSFTTLALSVATPTVSVEGAPANVVQSPIITLSPYTTVPDPSVSYLSTDWEVRKTSDNSLVFSSYGDTVNKESITVPFGFVVQNTEYLFRARYNSTVYGSSAYGELTATTSPAFVDTLFNPLNVYEQFDTGIFASNGLASFNATTSVMAYVKRLPSETSQVPRTTNELRMVVIGTNTTTQSTTFDFDDSILVKSGVYWASYSFSVIALTETAGLISWIQVTDANVYSLHIRPFQVVDGVITLLGSATTVFTNSSTNTIDHPVLVRMTNSTAVLAVCLYGGTYYNCYLWPITSVGDAIAVGTAASRGNLSGSPYVPTLTARDTTRFIVGFHDGTSSTKYSEFGYYNTSGSGASASLTYITGVSPAPSGSSGAYSQPPQALYLMDSLFLVMARNMANGAIEIKTMAVTTGALTLHSNGFNGSMPSAGARLLFRVDNVTAIQLTQNQVFKYVYTATTAGGLTQTVNQTTFNMGSNYQNNYISPNTPSINPTSEYYLRVGTNFTGANYTILDRFEPTTNTYTQGTYTKLYTYAVPNAPGQGAYYYYPSYRVLSATRAIVLTMIGDEDGLGRYVWEFRLLDISGSIPTEILSQKFVKTTPTSPSIWASLCVLSPNRIVLYDRTLYRLFSVTDSAITFLGTVDIPAGMRANSTISMWRLSDTRAIVASMPSDQQVYAYMVDITGDTLTTTTPVQVSLTVTGATGYDRFMNIAAGSATRALVTWFRPTAMYATLLDIDGDVINPTAVETLVSSGSPTAAPNELKPIDATRYMHLVNISNVANFKVIQDNTTSISSGSYRAISSPVYNSYSGITTLTPLSPSNGVVVTQQSSPNQVNLYKYTVGSGTATPTLGALTATVVDNAGSSNFYNLSVAPVSYAGDSKSINVAATLISWDSIAINNSVKGDGFSKAQKFVKGS